MLTFLTGLVGAFMEKGFNALLQWLQARDLERKLKEGAESKARLEALEEKIERHKAATAELKALAERKLLNDWGAAP